MNGCFVRVLLMFLIMSTVSSCGSDHDRSAVNGPPAVTMEEVYFSPITQVVGQPIKIKTKITYELYNDPFYEDFLPFPPTALLASALCILNQELEKYMEPRFRGQGNANLFIVSEEIRKEFDNSWVEHYYFRKHKFDRNLTYLLTGTIAYRDWISPPPLDDPIFISQSNNPVYWSSTFEFRLDKLAVVDE